MENFFVSVALSLIGAERYNRNSHIGWERPLSKAAGACCSSQLIVVELPDSSPETQMTTDHPTTSTASLNTVALRAAIEGFLAATPYEPCLLLASPDIATLQAAQGFVQEQYEWPLLSLGRVLAEALVSVPPRRRPRRVRVALRSALQEALAELATRPVLCADVDLVFHPDLQQDPLRLLRDASRQSPLVVLWPGRFHDDVLSYAVEAHAHYRTWPHPDLCAQCIVNLS